MRNRQIKRVGLAYILFISMMLMLCLDAGRFKQVVAVGPHYEALAEAGLETNEVLIRFNEDATTEGMNQFMAEYGLTAVRNIPRLDVWVVVGTQPAMQQLMTSTADDMADTVMWVEPNYPVYATAVTPDDSFYLSQQENLRLIGLPDAWGYTTGITTPVAIIDTGADLNHPDLASKIWTNLGELAGNGIDDDGNGYIDDVQGWNFVAQNGNAQDDHSHGSHVSGIVAAHTNNHLGIAGISWHSTIMPLKALNNRGAGTVVDVAEAIRYAADNGIRIINLSLGTKNPSIILEEAVSYAFERGCLVVASTGNEGGDVLYPAAYPQVTAVAATTSSDLPWTFGNRGPEVDIAAPGVNIFSANRQGSYYLSSGTSMAAAHISGVAALVWALRPELTADEVRNVLTTTARDIWSPGQDNLTGWGRVDAAAAVAVAGRSYVYLPYIVYSSTE
ncbi:MAG: S8 family serine peptidase [Chloroflexi bacterium]|nr:S8 family serine peptidase [Chloroflexota bacterium]